MLTDIGGGDGAAASIGTFSKKAAAELDGRAFDRRALAERGRPYERLDQLVLELLLGVR